MTLSPTEVIVAQYTGLIASWLNSMIRRERLIPTQTDARLDLEMLHERDESQRTDYQVERDDFIAVLEAALEPTLREVVELKRLEWTNQQIASALNVSIRTIQSRLKKIEKAVDALLKKSDHPSPITHHPSTINHQPSTINHQPSTINAETRNHSWFLWTNFVLRFSFDSTARYCPNVALDT